MSPLQEDVETYLGTPELFRHPYPLYALLRDRAPAYWSPTWGAWLVSTYADAKSVLERPKLFSSADRVRPQLRHISDQQWIAISEIFGGHRGLFWSDPPQYTADRALMTHAFRPRLDGIEPRIAALIDSLLEAVVDNGQMDVVHDLAHPLPASVIFEIVGVPAEDRQEFRGWVDEIIRFPNPPDDQWVEATERAMAAATDWCRALLEERRRSPRDDMLTDFARSLGDAPAENDVRSMVVNLIHFLIAGHETTTSLIASGLYSLLRHPDQLRILEQDPGRVPDAIEELLRFESPLQFVTRRAAVATMLGGHRIEEGESVIAILGSANRDARAFVEPERLAVLRKPNRHLAFGLNVHFCLGAPLARLEARLTFTRLLERVSDLHLVSEIPAWQANAQFRGLEQLPVTFSAR